MDPTEVHNRLARDLMYRIVQETGSPEAAMVVAESLTMGVALYAAGGSSANAAEYVEHMTQAVIERLSATTKES